MSPEQQQIAIAEACNIEQSCIRCETMHGLRETECPQCGAEIKGQRPLPDYLSDLNAMFEALRGLCWVIHTCDAGYRVSIHTPPEQGEQKLTDVVGDDLCATMAEAFLKARNLWKE